MIIKQRMSLMEKVLLVIAITILVAAMIGMVVVAFWLSSHDLLFLIE